jgi:hypothetical protein
VQKLGEDNIDPRLAALLKTFLGGHQRQQSALPALALRTRPLNLAINTSIRRVA